MRIEEIKRDVISKMPTGVNNALMEYLRDFKVILATFYGEYFPVIYTRTFQFNSSAIIIPASGGEHSEGSIKFVEGGYNGGISDGEIHDMNMAGNHGGVAQGQNVFETAQNKVASTYSQYLYKGLVAAGIPLH